VESGTPSLFIVAGANASGKTTFAGTLALLRDIPYIDPDALAPPLQSVRGGRAALSLRSTYLGECRTFAVETTLAGQSIRRLVSSAKRLGYKIVLVFIGTNSPDINLKRISERTQAGGHGVAPAIVRRRYERGLRAFRDVVAYVDECHVFDNSGSWPPTRVATMLAKTWTIQARADWAAELTFLRDQLARGTQDDQGLERS
jgi:predicted ABC-type ATPase